jgi:hypothetical protein
MPLGQFACDRKDARSLLNKKAKIRSSLVHQSLPWSMIGRKQRKLARVPRSFH